MSQIRREHETQSRAGRNFLLLLAVLGGGYFLYDQGRDSVNTANSTEEDSTTEEETNGPERVLATAIPLMPGEEDTTPGLMPFTLDQDMNSNATVAEVMNRIWEMYEAATPQERRELEAQFMFEQILTGETTFENDRQLTVETLGLGFTPETVGNFSFMDAYARRYFTSASLNAAATNNEEITPLVFNGNPAENNYAQTVFFEEDGIDRTFLAFQQFDNVRALNVVAALDLLKEITLDNGQSAWNALSPSERMDFALSLSDLWFNQRITGPAEWGQLTFNVRTGNQTRELFSVVSDDEGFVACRVQADDNSDDREGQNLTTQRVLITEQENDFTAPFAEDSRYGNYAIALAIDTNTLSEVVGNLRGGNLVNTLLNRITSTSGAYEIIDLSTGHTAIPANYEFDGQPARDAEEGDLVYLFRPCGRSTTQVEVIPTAAPQETPVIIVTPPSEETPPPTRTPEPTPTPEPEKDPIGDQTNPDGETQPDPTGGVINDPEAEQGSDTNPGSGR
jgi:hypothetical protein